MADCQAPNNGDKVEERPNGGGGDKGYGTNGRMPVKRMAPYYNMNHKNRGMAIIFNHEHFDIKLPERRGTGVDGNKLLRVLRALGFKVTLLEDLKATDVHKYLREASQMDHSDNDCLIVSVLTHGELGMLYARDTHYKPEGLWRYFTADKCPTLAGKPKLFFIQACQGDEFDAGTLLSKVETDGASSTHYRFPHADFLIVYSHVPGYYSWRNTIQGSWFIQALCEELRKSESERDILTVLTFVCQKVALDFESNNLNKALSQKKQVPCITSMLTKLLVFQKKN